MPEVTAQQWKLFNEACKWFTIACNAYERGDKTDRQVALLAHSMTKAAYDNTMRPNGVEK